VLKEQGQPSKPLAEGAALHSVLFRAVEDFKRFVYTGTPMDPGKALEGDSGGVQAEGGGSL
jgi:CRISPR-associated protein Csa1